MSKDTLLTGMPGGWHIETPVSAEHKKVFEEALQNHLGVKYDPIIVATQVINGTNYIFVAKATPVVKNPSEGLAKIHIQVSPAGSPPKLMDISPIVLW